MTLSENLRALHALEKALRSRAEALVAAKVDRRWLYVTASDLHREAGGYPASEGNHRL